MREYAVRANAKARRRQREAKSKAEAQNWSRVVSLMAERTCKRARASRRFGAIDNARVRSSFRFRSPQKQSGPLQVALDGGKNANVSCVVQV